MSMMDMLYVKETPWANLGKSFEKKRTDMDQVMEDANLGWSVATSPMHAMIGNEDMRIMGYNAIFREDTGRVLGVVNNNQVHPTQNVDMFRIIQSLVDTDFLELDSVGSLGFGENVYGCFKIPERYKVLDDEIEHYLVVFNEHHKSDGKITVVNTPVRVVCANMMTTALAKSYQKMRFPIIYNDDYSLMEVYANKIREVVGTCNISLANKAETWRKIQVDNGLLDNILDELFPFVQVDDSADFNSHMKANEQVEIARDVFKQNCLYNENLENYKGTGYAVYNGVVDFFDHYYKSAEKAYDLNFRMNNLPGFGASEGLSKIKKVVGILQKAA